MKNPPSPSASVALACLCGLFAGLPVPGRAEGGPAARSRKAIESLLGSIDPALSPIPGAPLLLPDVPAPLQVPAPDPDKFMALTAQAVLEQVQALEQRTGLRGQDYFSKRPDAPKLKIGFHGSAESGGAAEPCPVKVGDREMVYAYGAQLNRWYPQLGPVRSYRASYCPTLGETRAPLTDVEIQLDKNLYARVFQDAARAYGPGYFQDEKAAASRLALFLAPRAAADLELARLMDEVGLADGIRADAIEELRLLWEVAALRAQLGLQEALLADPGFQLLPAERGDLARRFDNESLGAVLAPQDIFFTNLAARDWEKLDEQALGIPMLELKSREPDDELQDRTLRAARSLLRETQRWIQAEKPKLDVPLLFRLLAAQRAEAYLAQPGAAARLREALQRERGRALSLPDLSNSAAGLFIVRTTAADAAAAAEEFDLDGLESRLRGAEAAARRYRLNFDAAEVRKSLMKRYFTMDRGLALFQSGDTRQRRTVIASFGAMGSQAAGAIPALKKVLAGRADRPEVRAEAAAALGKMGSAAVPALIAGLDDGNGAVQKEVIDSLAKQAPASIHALAEALDDPYDRNGRMIAATWTLGDIGAPAVPACLNLLKRPNPRTRFYALRALEAMGPAAKRALPALKELVSKDPAPFVREEAAKAIQAIR